MNKISKKKLKEKLSGCAVISLLRKFFCNIKKRADLSTGICYNGGGKSRYVPIHRTVL